MTPVIDHVESSHKCNVCDTSLANKINLTQHMKIHTEVETYTCPNCSQTFTRSDILKRVYLESSDIESSGNISELYID